MPIVLTARRLERRAELSVPTGDVQIRSLREIGELSLEPGAGCLLGLQQVRKMHAIEVRSVEHDREIRSAIRII